MRKTALKPALTAALVAMSLLPLSAGGTSWKTVKETDGVTLYAPVSTPQNYVRTRAVTEVAVTRRRLISILSDVKNHHKWQGYGVYTYVISEVSPREMFVHTVLKAPWPFSDREIISRARVRDTGPETTLVTINNIKSDYNPYADRQLVRVPFSRITWRITSLEQGRVRVEFTADADPGGSIPLWLYRKATDTMPVNTLRSLRSYAEKYASARSL